MNFAATAVRRVPILTWARRYEPRMLGGDALAGLVVIALAVPQALGYAGTNGACDVAAVRSGRSKKHASVDAACDALCVHFDQAKSFIVERWAQPAVR